MSIKTNNHPKFHAFTVSDKSGKPSFQKVGAAWDNQSGGLNIRLDNGFTGDIYLFPPKERKVKPAAAK